MSKSQKDFSRSIDKISTDLEKIIHTVNQAKISLNELCENAKQVTIVSSDAITPLFADDQPLTGDQVTTVEKPKRRRRKAVDLDAAPGDTVSDNNDEKDNADNADTTEADLPES